MRINYNVTGNERKALVKVISEATGEKAIYKFTPTYAFDIGAFTVSRYGVLEYDDSVDAEAVLVALSAAGYEGEAEGTADDTAEEASAEETAEASDAEDEPCETTEDSGNEELEETTEPSEVVDGLTVQVPRHTLSDTALENLRKLVDSKATLIKKAVGADALPIQVTDEKVSFPWFRKVDADSARAYTVFIAKLCEMAKNATRVTAADREVDNEKYAFRCFLLRLGFIGAEYKTERKILLQNLSGSSAFKSGHRKETAEGGADNEISE